jgi:hypothetical protein
MFALPSYDVTVSTVEWLGPGVRMNVESRVKKIQVGKSRGGRK